MQNQNTYSDNELVLAFKGTKQEQEKAFGEVYSRYSQRIYAYCLRVTGNSEDANDIFQEAFLKFYDSISKYEEITNVFGLLITITRNLCLNHKRDKKSTVDIEKLNFFTNDTGYEQQELLDLIAYALELLDFEYREAFIFRLYHGMPYKEISEFTGDSIATIKNRVWRAKEKIKEILTPYLEDLSK